MGLQYDVIGKIIVTIDIEAVYGLIKISFDALKVFYVDLYIYRVHD